jgi:hypothetical protein
MGPNRPSIILPPAYAIRPNVDHSAKQTQEHFVKVSLRSRRIIGKSESCGYVIQLSVIHAAESKGFSTLIHVFA